jgi:hypothetical protein
VGDQGGGDLVDTGVARERSATELGELAVIAAGQALSHLADVLLYDVEVVQEPLPGRSHVELPVAGGREPRMRVVENATRRIEPNEQRRRGATAGSRSDPLRASDRACALGEPVGAQQLTAKWAGEQVILTRSPAGEEASEEGGGSPGS